MILVIILFQRLQLRPSIILISGVPRIIGTGGGGYWNRGGGRNFFFFFWGGEGGGGVFPCNLSLKYLEGLFIS